MNETLRSERQTTALQGDMREASAEVRRLEQQVAFLQEQNRGLLLSLMSMSSGATGTSNTAMLARTPSPPDASVPIAIFHILYTWCRGCSSCV